MLKTTFMATALSAVLLMPAYAQMPAPNAGKSRLENSAQAPNSVRPPQSPSAEKGNFVRSETSSDWRGSQLVGAAVYGPQDQSIGDINEVLIDDSGSIRAVVIGVGGFLGVGEKDVAIPFEALELTRKQNGVDKVWVNYTKEELENAPKFAYRDASQQPATTGAGSSASGAYDSVKSKLNDMKDDIKSKVDSMQDSQNETKSGERPQN